MAFLRERTTTSAISRSVIKPWSSMIRACIAASEMVSTHSGAR